MLHKQNYISAQVFHTPIRPINLCNGENFKNNFLLFIILYI